MVGAGFIRLEMEKSVALGKYIQEFLA